ncbi:MAG: Bug family tripartite tricarboxylate transporter substrate binding protein [Xanthobacteraceae bacterium]
MRRLGMMAAVFVVVLAWVQPGAASTVEEFYRGKQIKMVLPTAPGGSTSLYGFTLAEFMSRHVPGHPTIVPEHRPGAGGAIAAGYVYNAAPKDGTTITMLLSSMITLQLTQPGKVKFDIVKYSYVGRIADLPRALIAWHAAGLNTIDDAKKREVPLGASGQGSNTVIHPALLNALVGTKFKIVTGYRGAGDTYLALERGELAATTVAWDGLVAQRGDWLKEGKVKVLVRIGYRKIAGFEKVPSLSDLGATAEDKAVLELVLVPSEIGQAVAAPPGVPPDRLAALQRAFNLTMKDTAFLEYTRKRRMPVKPMTGEELRELIVRGMNVPKSVVQRTMKLIAGL